MISGYSPDEAKQRLFNSNLISPKDLQTYQYPSPEKSLIDTVKNVAIEDPQHPPLYYIMVRLWVQGLGNSVSVVRSLSALISLLIFPCIYWLCLELFESPLVGWVAIILTAVSPFHVLYAQEAREYSLLTVTILLSSAALLQAVRLKTKFSWGTYAATVSLGLYSNLLFGFVAVGHGIYIVATESFRWSKIVTSYSLASLGGLLTFVPWLTYLNRIDAADNNVVNYGLLFLIRGWGLQLTRVFFDIDFSFNNPLTYLSLPILILEGYSIYFLCLHTPKRIWLFILTLIGVTALVLLLPDLIFGGWRSVVSRYLIACYLGIEIAIAYLITTKITSISVNISRQKLWQIAMIILISSGVLSCAINSPSQTSWHKTVGNDNPQEAIIINQASSPVLISDAPLAELFSISYLLDPKVKLQLVSKSTLPKIPERFSNLFLYSPSKALRFRLEKEQNYKTEILYKGLRTSVWEVVSVSSNQ